MPQKTVLVTGCSSGIGAATARRLTGAGYAVLGVDRTPPADGSDLARFLRADLADRTSIDALVAAVVREHPRIDGLCTIAGVPGTAPVELLARVDYLGIRHLTGLVAEHMGPGGSVAGSGSTASPPGPVATPIPADFARRSASGGSPPTSAGSAAPARRPDPGLSALSRSRRRTAARRPPS